MHTTRAMGVALVIVLAAGSTGAQTRPPAEDDGAVRIMPAEFAKLLASGAVVAVDTRGAEAYRQGHIPGAIQIALSDLTGASAAAVRAVERLKAAGKLVVTYCACPHDEAAARAAVLLTERGVSDVRALLGGWTDWVDGGRPVVRGDR